MRAFGTFSVLCRLVLSRICWLVVSVALVLRDVLLLFFKVHHTSSGWVVQVLLACLPQIQRHRSVLGTRARFASTGERAFAQTSSSLSSLYDTPVTLLLLRVSYFLPFLFSKLCANFPEHVTQPLAMFYAKTSYLIITILVFSFVSLCHTRLFSFSPRFFSSSCSCHRNSAQTDLTSWHLPTCSS